MLDDSILKFDLNVCGYKVLYDNYFQINEKNILKEYSFFLEKYSSPWINTSRIGLKEIQKIDEIKKVLENILETLKVNSMENKVIFEDLWLINGNKKKYAKDKLPNIPHIDKIRKFKVMFYLNNIDLSNGPIHIANCSASKYEDFRKNLPDDYKSKELNVISDLELKKFRPIIGKFGTIIFFDTNTPHYAGPFLDYSTSRKILRFNFKYV